MWRAFGHLMRLSLNCSFLIVAQSKSTRSAFKPVSRLWGKVGGKYSRVHLAPNPSLSPETPSQPASLLAHFSPPEPHSSRKFRVTPCLLKKPSRLVFHSQLRHENGGGGREIPARPSIHFPEPLPIIPTCGHPTQARNVPW